MDGEHDNIKCSAKFPPNGWGRKTRLTTTPADPFLDPDRMLERPRVDEAYEAVRVSYHRCEESGDLFDTFYDIFFTKSPEISPKFADTEMEKQKASRDGANSTGRQLRFVQL